MSDTPNPTPPLLDPTLTVEDAFYGSDESVLGSFKPQVADAINSYRDATGMSSEAGDALALELAHAVSDAKLDPYIGPRIVSNLLHYLNNPADDATRQQWTTESRQRMRQQYGEEGAEQRMAVAREFIAARPDLREMLNESGYGSHPDVVLAIAAEAHRLRVKPRQRFSRANQGGSR